MDVPDQWGVWERIADSFDGTRDRTWPHVVSFLESLPSGRLLDVMAGNGRHAAVAAGLGHDAVATDWSRPVTRVAADKGIHGVAADATRLPFRSACFGAAVYVAGLHGIPEAAGRAASLRELHRVLRPGGVAQVTVWSREAPRFQDQGPPGEAFDAVVPWRAGGHDERRYYRLYTLDALAQECEAAGFTVEAAEHVAVACGDGWDNEVVRIRRGTHRA